MSSRERILDAAMETFARYGYRRASMDQVADTADLTRQALYHHFESKEALFRAVVEALHEGALQAAAAGGAPPSKPAVRWRTCWPGRSGPRSATSSNVCRAARTSRSCYRSTSTRPVTSTSAAMSKCLHLRSQPSSGLRKPGGLPCGTI